MDPIVYQKALLGFSECCHGDDDKFWACECQLSAHSQKTDVQRHVQRPRNLQLKLAHQNFPFSLKLDSCRLIRGCEPSQPEFESKPYVISLFRELIEYILQFDILQSLFY